MKFSEFKQLLEQNSAAGLRFVLPDDDVIPAHAHITEVGRVDRTFLDCGSTVRRISTCNLQAWVADDFDHRLTPGRLAKVLDLAESLFAEDDLNVEIEYEDCNLSQFPVTRAVVQDGVLTFQLDSKHADCLAKDVCLPNGAADGGNGGCCGGGNC